MSLIPENISKIFLSRSTLSQNVRALQAAIGPQKALCCVVKSDAYGHGLEQLVPELVHLGQQVFAVSHVAEALWIRKQVPQARMVLLVEPLTRCLDTVVQHRLEPVLSTAQDVLAYQQHSHVFETKNIRVHFKVDTGMGRLGLRPDEFQTVLNSVHLPKNQTIGLMTHFSTAESPQDSVTREQIQKLRQITTWAKEKHTSWEIHAANSAATLNGLVTEFTHLFRVGLALYGGIADSRLTPLLRWESVVSHVRSISKGQPVGYGHTWVAQRNTRLAIVPVGYRLGYRLSQSNVGWVQILDRSVPVVGRVSMDMITVDVTDLPATDQALVGKPVVLLSNDSSVRDRNSVFVLAENANTIPYEIFCGIHSSISRRWET